MNEHLPQVALIHQQFGPYHVARALALDLRMPGRVTYLQLASREASREWHVAGPAPAITTIAEGVLEEISDVQLARGVTDALDRLRPGVVVIAGYGHRAMRAAARWCRRNAAIAILLSDSHHVDRRRHRMKELVKRTWLSHNFDAAFTAGAASAAYAQTLGFASSRIWRGYDVVDNAFFAASAAAARARGSTLLRDLGLPEHVFVYVGRFSAEKNLPGLLAAMAEYRRKAGTAAWGLLLVGSGPECDALQRHVRAFEGHVAIVGFRGGEALAEVYAAAQALILPSTSEPWGLVVNEAMACGLPVLVSDRAGAAQDLVFPGLNGYVFDPESKEDMVQSMLRMSSPSIDRSAMGVASQRIVANFTPATWATTLADCIELSVIRRQRGG